MTTPLHHRRPVVRPTAYVGGPMTNRPKFNFDAFDSLSNWLEYQQGWKVHNPHAHDQELYPGIDSAAATKVGDVVGIAAEVGFSFQGAMSWDLARVAESDHMVLLPEWETSTGAKAERFVAEMTGSQIWLAYPAPGVLSPWYITLDPEQKRLSAPVLDKPLKAMRDGEPEESWHRDVTVESLAKALSEQGYGTKQRDKDAATVLEAAISPTLHDPNQQLDRPALKARGWVEREPDTFVKDVQAVREGSPFTRPDYGSLQPTPTPVIDQLVQIGQFQTKDSGAREEFDSGMVRDTQEGKPRYDLIPLEPLKRMAELYARGAQKYGDRNWEKATGAEELERFKASGLRHFFQALMGDRDEDHWAGAVFNIFGAMWLEERLSPVPSVMENDKDA